MSVLSFALIAGNNLILDFFLEDDDVDYHNLLAAQAAVSSPDTPSSKVANIFKGVESAITDKIVSETNAVFKFVVGGVYHHVAVLFTYSLLFTTVLY